MKNEATTSAMIVRNDAALTVSFTPEAEKLKAEALEAAGIIGKVTSQPEQIEAVHAQTAIKTILSQAEKARKMCKEPVLEYGRRIDEAHRRFCLDLNDEMTRLSRMVGTFQQEEIKRQQAEEQARNQRLAELERERAVQVAKAKNEQEMDAVQAHFDQRAKVEAPPPEAPARVEGQRIDQDWEIAVTDIHELYRHHPNCVKLEARLSEIKALLKAGGKIRGIMATPIVKAGVRVQTGRALIEV